MNHSLPPRKMPREMVIRRYWVEMLWKAKGYDSPAEFLEPGTCFACGMEGKERAHILARADGGSDLPGNLHILCRVCHKDSERLDGEKYMTWLMERSPIDRLMSEAMRYGANFAFLM